MTSLCAKLWTAAVAIMFALLGACRKDKVDSLAQLDAALDLRALAEASNITVPPKTRKPQLRISLKDADGNPASGIPVTFRLVDVTGTAQVTNEALKKALSENNRSLGDPSKTRAFSDEQLLAGVSHVRRGEDQHSSSAGCSLSEKVKSTSLLRPGAYALGEPVFAPLMGDPLGIAWIRKSRTSNASPAWEWLANPSANPLWRSRVALP